jgi:hypothetical protein
MRLHASALLAGSTCAARSVLFRVTHRGRTARESGLSASGSIEVKSAIGEPFGCDRTAVTASKPPIRAYAEESSTTLLPSRPVTSRFDITIYRSTLFNNPMLPAACAGPISSRSSANSARP